MADAAESLDLSDVVIDAEALAAGCLVYPR